MAPSAERPRKRSTPQLASADAMGTVRPLMFELHIRPMFRSLDREHMSFALNLWEYNNAPPPQQLQFYERILKRLKATDPGVVMPPPNEGGPWPAEWIALFERWISEGMKQLDKATADVATFVAVRDPGTPSVTFTGNGTKPSAGHVVWIERSYDPNQMYAEYLPNEFVLYQEQRVTSAATPVTFSIDDYFDVPLSLSQLTIVDSAGKHLINIS